MRQGKVWLQLNVGVSIPVVELMKYVSAKIISELRVSKEIKKSGV